MSRTALFASALVASSLLACSPANVGGSDAGSDAPGEAGTSPDKACADWAYGRCTRLMSCSPTLVQVRYGDVGTCESGFKAFCLANLTLPSTGQSPDNLEACAGAIGNWDCADYIFEANPPPECVQVTGSVANGAGCAAAGQCQSGFCAIVPGAACGTCTPPPGAGASCAQLTTCGMGLSCDGDSNTCVAPPGQGASCAPGQSCALGLECIGENASTGAIGTCQPAVESGGACSSTTAECDFFAGFTCDDDSKTCVAVPVVAGGQPCNYVASLGETQFCGSGQKCLTADAGAQGTCTTAASTGAACDLVAGPGCVSPVRCISADGGTGGICALPGTSACN